MTMFFPDFSRVSFKEMAQCTRHTRQTTVRFQAESRGRLGRDCERDIKVHRPSESDLDRDGSYTSTGQTGIS